MSERNRDVHVHVEREDTRPYDPYDRYDERAAEESAAAASFFTAQLLWIVLIALIVVLIAAALGSGLIDFNFSGSSPSVDPAAAPTSADPTAAP